MLTRASPAKELKMAFKKRATGALRAVATLSDAQRAVGWVSDRLRREAPERTWGF